MITTLGIVTSLYVAVSFVVTGTLTFFGPILPCIYIKLLINLGMQPWYLLDKDVPLAKAFEFVVICSFLIAINFLIDFII